MEAMRHALLLVLFALGLAAPVIALGADSPPSAATVAACKAQYAQLGADAFVAKYGPKEPWGNCYAANKDATPPATSRPEPVKTSPTTTSTPAPDNSPEGQCKAEYAAIGTDAFAAKYGKPETFGNCVAAHGGKPAATPPTTTTPEKKTPPATTTTTPTIDTSTPEGKCKAEYLAIGPDAFKAKYGATETLGNCVKAHTPPPATPPPGAVPEAQALCLAEKQKLGADAFAAKYGPKEPFGNCVKAQTPKATTLIKACKSSSGTSKDAYKSCLTAATANTVRRR